MFGPFVYVFFYTGDGGLLRNSLPMERIRGLGWAGQLPKKKTGQFVCIYEDGKTRQEGTSHLLRGGKLKSRIRGDRIEIFNPKTEE